MVHGVIWRINFVRFISFIKFIRFVIDVNLLWDGRLTCEFGYNGGAKVLMLKESISPIISNLD